MPIKMLLNKGKVPVKIYTDDVDSRSLDQLTNIAQLPFIHSHIAAMPDVHLGIGATIGSVIPTKGAIIPSAVGVDIGCGMAATRLSIKADQLPDNLKSIRLAIEKAIPVGFNMHKSIHAKNSTIIALNKVLEEKILTKHTAIIKMMKKPHRTWTQQLGTLGGGNHFIEVCLDEAQNVWIMLHSGSRGIGNVIGRYFISLAKKDMEKHTIQLPSRDLAYFTEGAEYFVDYMDAVHWAQEYALFNRREMMRLILDALRKPLPNFEVTKETITCHHNYVAIENHFGEQVYLTRKGAIRAGKDELGIIPGSMGVKSYIVRGKGNPESFCSCSHGAGRKMSRSAAKKQFNTDDMLEQTLGVECRKDKGVIDEIPGAYKDIDQVMKNQSDLVEIVHTLKQVVCVKG
ncbi:MAG: RtcB family protein [Thiomargarita sp.]|nr:RtcB family protein [Thiomargarita sp.]